MLISIDVYATFKGMKLSAWASKMGISYRRAWQMFRDGKLPNARQLPTGTIVVLEDEEEKKSFVSGSVAIDARVSSHENRINLRKEARPDSRLRGGNSQFRG